MSENNDIVCVILAGGRGKRMGSNDCHKVCFPVVGKPAIVRAIDTYKAAGLRRFVVVVGQMAEQVMATVAAAHPEVSFVFQGEPRGTGHAALVAVESLAMQGGGGHVMIVMGDKVVQADTVRRFLASYRADPVDALMTVLPRPPDTKAGRVVTSADGRLLGLVEAADIDDARAASRPITVGGVQFSADEVEAHSQSINASMYMYRFGALRDALRHLSPSNVQAELYLTDTIAYLSESGKAATMLISDPEEIMAFNTPAELLRIEAVVSRREGHPIVAKPVEELVTPDKLKPAREWLEILGTGGPNCDRLFAGIYGRDREVCRQQRLAMHDLVQAFVGQFGPERPVVICRAPGRVNLMGRHIDHRGGHVNVMAINREALLVASPRDDDVVRLRHLDVGSFPNREFCIHDLLGEETWPGWMDFLDSGTVQRVLDAAPGDWSHYVRAPLLRLQYEHREVRLRGMDCMVSGNIPMGAGLSSSSALVVAFAEVAVALNGMDVAMHDFIDLCGEGEWFVGSRGGSADHAAIRAGQLGRITKIGFFPFRLVREVPLPTDLRVIIAHSGSKAVKSAGARDVFNHRVACYQLAELLLKARWPAAAGMEHLRDLAPDHLRVEAADVFRALTLLPHWPTREDLYAQVPEAMREDLESILKSHKDVGPYNVRGAALFGIAECMRSEHFAALLEAGDLEAVGAAMRFSHDGDRVAVWHGGESCPFRVDVSDAALLDMAARSADLLHTSGSYACSTEAIDQMVDVVSVLPGVVGAQLTGAGLGGCMMVLVREEAQDAVRQALAKQYYEPRGIEPNLHVCSPVTGAGILALA